MNPVRNSHRYPGRSSGRLVTATSANSGDKMLLAIAFLLTAIGLVMVYSASTFVAENRGTPDWYYFIRQTKLIAIGLFVMWMATRIDVALYRRFAKLLLLGSVIVMFLQLVTPLGSVIGGTRRWINLGIFNLQTSEVVRCVLVIFLARTLSDEPEIVGRLDKRFLKLLAVIGLPIVLTYLQHDLSGAVIMASVAGLLLFMGGLKVYIAAIGGVFASIAAFTVAMRTEYQRERLLGFFGRISDVSGGDNYQALQSFMGFGRGGIFGVGLGQGKQKMLFLPEPHTDFIFSIVGEELGLIGTTLVLAAFIVLTIRALRICVRQTERYKFLLGCGLAGSLILYALTNMCVAVGLLPVTGLPLPFISSGGTSLIVSMWSVGVLYNLSKQALPYGR